jgi:hypothetical protein
MQNQNIFKKVLDNSKVAYAKYQIILSSDNMFEDFLLVDNNQTFTNLVFPLFGNENKVKILAILKNDEHSDAWQNYYINITKNKKNITYEKK